MSMSGQRDRAVLAVRLPSDVKDFLVPISEAMGKKMGTKISQTQALEILIRDAYAAWCGKGGSGG